MKVSAKRSKTASVLKGGSLEFVIFRILSLTEKFLRSALLLGSIALIAYLVLVRFQSPEAYRYGSFFGNTTATLWGLGVYKAYRNFMYLFILPYIGLALILGTVEALYNRVDNTVRLGVYTAIILFLITFGYAIAGLITDFIALMMVVNWHLLKSQNLPVGDHPPIPPPFP